MPFEEYVKWSKYFKQKEEQQEHGQPKVPGRNLLENPDSLVKGLTL